MSTNYECTSCGNEAHVSFTTGNASDPVWLRCESCEAERKFVTQTGYAVVDGQVVEDEQYD